MNKNIPTNQHFNEEFRLIEEMLNYESRYTSMKYKKILSDLKSNNEMLIYEAIANLSTELSMAEESALTGFQFEAFIPEIIKCLKLEGIPDIMLHASASLIHILDLIPEASNSIVNCGGVQVLIQKIQNIDFIDVGEKAIKVLEKVSYDFGDVILTNWALPVFMNLIDFFVTPIQVKKDCEAIRI